MDQTNQQDLWAMLEIPDFLKRDAKKDAKRFKNRKPIAVADFYKAPEIRNPKNVIPLSVPKVKKADRVVPNVQKRIWEKGGAIIAEIEGMIDDGEVTPEWSFYEYATKKGWSSPVAKRVAEHFLPRANELLEVISMPDDKELQYAYRGYDQDDITAMAVTYQNLVDEATKYAVNAKKIVVRRKKLPSVEKLLKRFVYSQTNNTYKLVSIDPVKILKAQALWVFHPKTNTLTVFRAIDRGGLSIKGTSIINYDEKNSMAKTMGRKVEERLHTVLNGGKATLRKLMDTWVGGKAKIGRITKNHILLRVE